MPRVRIETTEQLSSEAATALMNDVTGVMVETFGLASDDRTVSFTSYPPGMFLMKPPYCLFIEILLFRGRSTAVKKKFYRALVTAIEKKHAIPPERIMIVLNEQPRENWALRGGIAADEIDFDYTITI